MEIAFEGHIEIKLIAFLMLGLPLFAFGIYAIVKSSSYNKLPKWWKREQDSNQDFRFNRPELFFFKITTILSLIFAPLKAAPVCWLVWKLVTSWGMPPKLGMFVSTSGVFIVIYVISNLGRLMAILYAIGIALAFLLARNWIPEKFNNIQSKCPQLFHAMQNHFLSKSGLGVLIWALGAYLVPLTFADQLTKIWLELLR